MTTSSPFEAASSSTEKVLEKKWSKTLIAAGFTALPNVVFRHQKVLRLKPLDLLVILHLASYWWKPHENPWPSKGLIADALDVDPRTVQRSIQKMERLGYVQRIHRKSGHGDNLSNEYDLRGLVTACKKFADEELRLKATRAAEDKSRRATPKTFALDKGGKQS